MKTDNILLVVNGNYQEDISFINDYTAFEFNRVELAYISHFFSIACTRKGKLSMGNPKKFIACTLAFSMALMPMVSGCGKKPRSNPKVEADSDWYNVTKVTLESEVDFSGVQYSQTNVMGKVGDCYVVWYRAQYPIPYDVDRETFDYKDYTLMQIDGYDSNGELLCAVDLFDAVEDSGLVEDAISMMSDAEETEEAPMYNVWDPEIKGDNLSVLVEVYTDPEAALISYEVLIDPVTGELSYEISEEGRDLPPRAEGTIFSTRISEYQIVEYIAHNDVGAPYSILGIKDHAGNHTAIDLDEQFPDTHIGSIIGYLDLGSGKILCEACGDDVFGPHLYFTVDTSTGTATMAGDGQYSWLSALDLSTCSYFEEIGNVIMDTHGIRKIDLENSEITEAVSFDSCNINRSDVSSLSVISYTEDEIVLMGATYGTADLYTAGGGKVLLVKLNKADSNPNAGKTILTAATTGTIGYAMSEAVCSFNETNPDYFIRFDPKYEVDQYMDMNNMTSMAMDESDYRVTAVGAYAQLTDQLTVDIIAGEGPDIIFDSSRLSQLNTDDYLLDLSDRINTDGLFGNIIEASKKDGKLYQIPLAFGITGIVTKTENVASGQTGFTFDEYGEFVDSVCNGNEPIAMNQTEFFITCLGAMGDLFYTEDGKIDYDNEAFRSLAEFTDNNIFPVENRTYQDVMVLDNAGGIYFSNGSFMTLLGNLQSGINDATILGIPSYDRRGPIASVGCSVAISSQSAEQDGCWSFIETLLSQEIQEYYAYDTDLTPVNTAAFDSVATTFVDDHNARLSFYDTEISPAELAMMNIDTTRVDPDVIDSYKTMIGSIRGVESTDFSVDLIIREEMPAYFFGQKTLDEVIPVLENRVQTFLDERE